MLMADPVNELGLGLSPTTLIIKSWYWIDKTLRTHNPLEYIERRQLHYRFHPIGGLTEQEIADKLGVDRTTISRDVTILKKMSEQFVYDLFILTM